MAGNGEADLSNIDQIVAKQLAGRGMQAQQQPQQPQPKPAGQPAPDDQMAVELLEEVVSDSNYVLSSRVLAEKLARAVEQTQMAKEGRLTSEAIEETGTYFGARFNEFIQAAAKAYNPRNTLANDEIKRISTGLGINFEAFAKEAARTNDARKPLTANEIRVIGKVLGVNFEDYEICHIAQVGQTQKKAFYIGDEKPAIRPSDMPLKLLEQANPETGMCLEHQAVLAIKSYKKDATEAYLIKKWEEFDSAAARKRLAELRLEDVAIFTYFERIQKAGSLVTREGQALVFPMGLYTANQKYAILANLRGEKVQEIPTIPAETQAYQPKAAEPAATVPDTKSSSIDELLPRGSLEEILTVKIVYEGATYKFLMPVLLNEFRAIDGEEGYMLAGNEEVTFTGKRYVEDAAARKEVELKLIAKDKRLRTRLSPDMLSNMEAALKQQNSPAAKQSLIKMVSDYLKGEGTQQQ